MKNAISHGWPIQIVGDMIIPVLMIVAIPPEKAPHRW
jgi:hypothetical protein